MLTLRRLWLLLGHLLVAATLALPERKDIRRVRAAFIDGAVRRNNLAAADGAGSSAYALTLNV